MINGQTVDVGKATIINLMDRTIHTMQMPNTTLKVSVASVKPGHEDLAPPVQLGGEEDETPKRLADCKGYPMAEGSSSCRVGRRDDHTNDNTSPRRYEHHHPASAITSAACYAG